MPIVGEEAASPAKIDFTKYMNDSGTKRLLTVATAALAKAFLADGKVQPASFFRDHDWSPGGAATADLSAPDKKKVGDYLGRSGANDLLTKLLVALFEAAPTRPSNPAEFIRNFFEQEAAEAGGGGGGGGAEPAAVADEPPAPVDEPAAPSGEGEEPPAAEEE